MNPNWPVHKAEAYPNFASMKQTGMLLLFLYWIQLTPNPSYHIHFAKQP